MDLVLRVVECLRTMNKVSALVIFALVIALIGGASWIGWRENNIPASQNETTPALPLGDLFKQVAPLLLSFLKQAAPSTLTMPVVQSLFKQSMCHPVLVKTCCEFDLVVMQGDVKVFEDMSSRCRGNRAEVKIAPWTMKCSTGITDVTIILFYKI
jgi:hypothetical protein